MDRNPIGRPSERQMGTAPPPSSHASPFPPPTTAQPPVQLPLPDPFHSGDPFLPGGGRRSSLGFSSRVWPSSQHLGSAPTSSNLPNHHQQHHHQRQHHSQPSLSTQPLLQGQSLPPPPPTNGMSMPPPYDALRRRSLGGSGSSPQLHGAGTGGLDSLAHSPWPSRNMPPPSSPQNAPSSSFHPSSGAPRGPPTTSPFAGVRDLGSSHHRAGMSISAILGGGEERKPNESPHSSAVAPLATPRSMQPPSPGRARSSSMRESGSRGYRNVSPPRTAPFGEQGRMASEPRRDGVFGSPQYSRESGHSFRAFQPPMQEQPHHFNGHGAPVRPNSQPVEMERPRVMEEHRERESHMSAGGFRYAGELMPTRSAEPPRAELHRQPFHPPGITSHPQERGILSSPQMDRERSLQGARYSQGNNYGPPPREEHASLFRPTYQPTSHPLSDAARESIEGRAPDMRRQLSRPSPPPGDISARNGYHDRPMTFEEHQRLDAIHREQRDQHRKESDGSVHRAVLNLSPELNRRGRNSPLPQAVQGAQPRHVGPGGDNPGIKMEFGRMFSGLGSGVGTTPAPNQSINGTATPSRMSPSVRHMESGDLVRQAVAEIDDKRSGTKTGSRRGGRRSRDEIEGTDDRSTPTANKRSKLNTAHHHHHHVHPHHSHHHHHHHHEAAEVPAATSMFRYPSNPLSHANLMVNQAHHHHHHHAHPVGHHHHRAARPVPPARKPITTISSKKVLDEIATKPRKHLGSQLYTTEVSPAPATETSADAKIKFSSKMKPIPVFQDEENGTFTVRVPRYFLTPTGAGTDGNYSLEEICKRRQIWGTDIYTDDSDVIAAAVHSGWLKGDFGALNDDLRDLCGNDSENEGDEGSRMIFDSRPSRPVKVPKGYDAHITLLILPPLESYPSTNQHHIWSRDWNSKHDCMSYMIHKIEFIDEGGNRFAERGAAARKKRISMEEAARREAAAGLLMFANGTTNGTGVVRVGA